MRRSHRFVTMQAGTERTIALIAAEGRWWEPVQEWPAAAHVKSCDPFGAGEIQDEEITIRDKARVATG